MAWESAYASDYIDLLLRLKEVVTGYPIVTMPIRSGVGDGIIHGIHTTESSTSIESWSVTCTDDLAPATFSVTGSVSGAQAAATEGVPYTNSDLSFNILEGSVPFVAGDHFVFSTQTNPLVAAADVWNVMRWEGTGAKVVNYLASSVLDGTGEFIPERAINNDAGSFWCTDQTSGANSWWQVEYDKPVEILRFTLTGYAANSWERQYPTSAPRDFNISYSDDGTAWTVAAAYTNQTGWMVNELRSFDVASAGGHTFWRFNFVTTNGQTYLTIPDLRLYNSDDRFNVGIYGDGYDVILRGKGLQPGEYSYVSLRPDSHVHNGPNWILGGSVGYTPSLDTFEQPDNCQDTLINGVGSTKYSDNPRLALYGEPMKYWIIVSGRRIMVFTRFQNICEGGHLGFPLVYYLPGQYPYPLLIAGSQSAGGRLATQTYGWNRTDIGHSLFMNPGMSTTFPATIDNSSSPFRLYTPFNYWKQAVNRNMASGSFNEGSHSMLVYPYQTEETTTWNHVIDAQADGKWPMSAVVIIDCEDQAQYGEIDGVKHIAGIHPIESLVTYEGDTWVILNNVFRVGENDFFAVRLS